MTLAGEIRCDTVAGDVTRHRNRAVAPSAAVELSVLVPFYGADPSTLLRALGACAAGLDGAVEIVCADDASPYPGFAERALATAVELAAEPPEPAVACTVLVAGRNRGRSVIRNLLAEQACGRHLLYLDGDMAVNRQAFLVDYLELLRGREVGIAFGGFDMEPTPADKDEAEHDLHVWSSRRDHCLPAAVRQRDPAKYTYTSNLLVRRDLMLVCPFSDAFRGWGWEDVDWAMRAAGLTPILHVDNPAVHRGFSSAGTLLRKYRESVANFRVLHERHRDAVERMPLFRAGRVASWLPFPGLVLAALERAVLDRRRLLPMRARDMALKLYRAWLYRDIAGRAPPRRKGTT